MRKSTWIISLVSFCITILFLAQVYIYNKASTQTSAAIHMSNFILCTATEDIDGDGKNDEITIFGKKHTDTDDTANEINISIKFSKTGFTKKTNDSSLNGASPELQICDFTGDGKNDVMLSVPEENNKTISTVIYDFSHSIPKNIFLESDNRGAKITMKYADNFIINATLNEKQKFAINLNKHSKRLVKDGIYTIDGKACINTSPQITKYCSLSPDDKDNDGIFGLYGTQKIVDKNNSTLCEVTSYLEYSGNKWQIYKIEYSYPKEESVN